MNTKPRESWWKVAIAAPVVAMAGLLAFAPASFWRTPDQAAQRLYEAGKFADAAKLFSDPMRQGLALFRDAKFEDAAVAFSRINTADGHFNRGNALVMDGKYEDAITAYDRALALHPSWRPAEENREIARLRAEKVKKTGGDMTGGAMEADEVVFEKGKKPNAGGQKEQTRGGEKLSDEQLQALWLRRVQTKPADFLRAKFVSQLDPEGPNP